MTLTKWAAELGDGYSAAIEWDKHSPLRLTAKLLKLAKDGLTDAVDLKHAANSDAGHADLLRWVAKQAKRRGLSMPDTAA